MPIIEHKFSIGNVEVPAASRALGVADLEVVADPGSGGTITPPALSSFSCELSNTAGSRTLGDAQYPGQIAVIHGGGASNPSITPQTGTWDGLNSIAQLNSRALIVAGMFNGGWRVVATDAVLALL